MGMSGQYPPLQETLLFNGEDYLKAMLELIRNSSKNIAISTYILKQDKVGSQVLAALKKQASKGIQVHLIVDGFGSLPWIESTLDKYEDQNFEIRVYHPLPWPFSKMKRLHWPRIRLFFSFLLNINRRNHQKLHIFDESIVMIGSRNINEDALLWRESNIMIDDRESASYCQSIFSEVWQLSHDHFFKRHRLENLTTKHKFNGHIFSSHKIGLRHKRNKYLLERLQNAQSKIYLTTPYLFPSLKFLNELRKKAEQGVDVRILLPKVSDVWLSKLITQLQYKVFLQSGIKIYEYQPSILHAKSLIIDDWALIGSSNFNQRSLLRDIEIDYCPRKKQTTDQLEEKFLQDIDQAESVLKSVQVNAVKRLFAIFLTKFFPSWF